MPVKPPIGLAQIDWSHPLARGLVGCWLFNEGGGSRVFDSARRNHGTLTNMDPASDWVNGKFGRALDFDGSDDYVNFGDYSATDGLRRLSVDLVVRVDNVTNSTPGRHWVGKWGGAFGTNCEWIISQADGQGGKLVFAAVTNGANYFLLTTTSNILTSGAWVRISVVWNGGTVGSIFVNGVQQAVTNSSLGSPTAIMTSTAEMRFGRQTAGTASLAGRIDRCVIYNRALTAAEVRQLYVDPFCFIRRSRVVGFVSSGGVSHDLDGATTCTTNTSASLTVGKPLSGSASTGAVTSGALVVGKPLGGSASCSAQTSGAVQVGKPLSGSINSRATTIAHLTIGTGTGQTHRMRWGKYYYDWERRTRENARSKMLLKHARPRI